MIKLYDGCYGRTKTGAVVGPIVETSVYDTPFLFEGLVDYWYDQNGNHDGDDSPHDIVEIIHVHHRLNIDIIRVALEDSIANHTQQGGYEWTVAEMQQALNVLLLVDNDVSVTQTGKVMT